ncbi:MAG: BAX protein [uncultured Sulfurovum sp.]|uniref:BAX protein n=1 Tax=uncultured Sulfurovum sp. TaxID=269237 RepID=A0A6S6U4V0_9BACT|nr:MAG: BAX protein [uncultured Sulfurovum sp.]
MLLTQRETMLNLNKIIYILLMLLILEVSLFALYRAFEQFSTKKTVTSPVPKANILAEPVYPHEDFFISLEEEERVKSLEEVLIHITPKSELDIVSIENQLVKPILYTKSINLSDLSIQHKKKMFINMIVPSILVAKHRISEERKKVAKLLKSKKLSPKEHLWLTKKRHIFKASTIDELYDKMELHPTSIVVAQAIIESGWGTSRFFEKANNVFGIWSFNKHEKRIEASETRGSKRIFLKKYTSVEQSVSDYFLMLSTKDAYRDFREKRLESQDPFVLVEQLGKYSELGDVYIQNLKNTITKNKLVEYDSYALDI